MARRLLRSKSRLEEVFTWDIVGIGMGSLEKCCEIKTVSRVMAAPALLCIRNGSRDVPEPPMGLAASVACFTGDLVCHRKVETRDVMNRSGPPLRDRVEWRAPVPVVEQVQRWVVEADRT